VIRDLIFCCDKLMQGTWRAHVQQIKTKETRNADAEFTGNENLIADCRQPARQLCDLAR
jgi:hypothetical protein